MAKLFKSVLRCEELIYLNAPTEPLVIAPETTRDEAPEALLQAKFAQGLSEGIKQAELEMAEERRHLSDLLKAIPIAISENLLQQADEIAHVVMHIAHQLFINQQHSKEAIAQQVNDTLAQLNNKNNIELALHPQDLALLQQGLLKIDLNDCTNLRVLSDEGLRLGGCRIKSEHGVFDASIERQIDNLKEALLKLKQGDRRE